MQSPRASRQQVCCDTSLCQHPDCWRFNLQRVREAVWRRNGIEPEHYSTTRSMNVDQVYLTKEQRLESTDGGLPTLKVVDMFSDLDDKIKSAPDRHLRQPRLHRRSTSLPSLSPDRSQPTTSPQIRMPYPSPIISPSARTEYQRKMLWKKQFTDPWRADSSLSRDSGNTVKVTTIGVHEVYEPEELCQEWEEVYVTSAYLVWCPSNKKKRKKRKGLSASSTSTTKHAGSNKVIPKDVTEDFVPAAMETIKTIRPKSTKTPTGGQPYSPHKSPANQSSLRHYGMEDLSDLPKPILSGMLKRIAQRSTEVTPEQDGTKEPDMASSPTPPTIKTNKLFDGLDLSTDFDSLLAKEERASKVRLAVDINSRFTTPAEDEELEKRKELDKSEKDKQEVEASSTSLNMVKLKGEDTQAHSKASREILRLNCIGVPIEDLPSPKSHHCMSSIPRRLSLGAALEPVNIVPIEGSPTITPPNEPQADQLSKSDNVKSKRSKKINEVFVNIPHCRASSALERSPHYGEEDRLYVHQSFRNSPSPVRAPAPTPSSPDKHSEFFRQHSRISHAHRSMSSQEEDMLVDMRRRNTVGDAGEFAHLEGLAEDPIALLRGSPVGRQEADKNMDVSEERIFLTEGFDTSEKTIPLRANTPETNLLVSAHKGEPPPDMRGRSPSPGSRTRIPKDIIEEFRGNLYGKQFSKAESKAKHKASKSKEIVLGPKITACGWRPPRSRTPVQLAETPARFAPRPLKQPPQESVPKSLRIVSIPTQNLKRPKSTPPRITTPNSDYITQVLSESSLHNNGSSVEVQGPSINLSGTGSVPPPPSPEALVLPNDLNLAVSTLEPLCEEDERSSRTTSIADFVEKSSGNPRLSPLGGGSEMSEESVDLPKELCEGLCSIDQEGSKGTQENQEEIDHNVAKQDNPVDATQTGESEEQSNNEKNVPETHESNEPQATELPPDTVPIGGTQPSEPKEPRPVSSNEPQATELPPDTVPIGGTQPSEPKEPRPVSSNEPQATELPPDTVPIGRTQPIEPKEPRPVSSNEPQASELPPETDPIGGIQPSEPKEPRPVLSNEPQATELPPDIDPSESPQEISHPRGSPEPAHQPPGSPDVTPDFTEGVDMNLDLTAQLQAAMEGLDDFVLGDDDDDGIMGIKDGDRGEPDDKNGDEENEINKDHDDNNNDDTNDDDDAKTDVSINDNNMRLTSDQDDSNNKADDDDENVIPESNDEKNMDHANDQENINVHDDDNDSRYYQ